MNEELPNINKFLQDKSKENLVVFELELEKIENPNKKFRAEAKANGQCACRLWLILFLANFIVLILFLSLALLTLTEIGPVPPYQGYGKTCNSVKCDFTSGLVCRSDGNGKTCQCPSGNWFWFNNTICRECPSNWIISDKGTKCYFVSHIQLNFTDANIWCTKSQSRLVEINNDDLLNTFQSIKEFKFNLYNFYWIGLREIDANQNVYRWITSITIFSNWNSFCSDQPAHSYNYYFQQYDQCIGLYIQSNTSSCFRDSTCPNIAPFLCELN